MESYGSDLNISDDRVAPQELAVEGHSVVQPSVQFQVSHIATQMNRHWPTVFACFWFGPPSHRKCGVHKLCVKLHWLSVRGLMHNELPCQVLDRCCAYASSDIRH